MNARTIWILGLLLATMVVFVGCGSQAKLATGPGPKTLEVIQPPAVQAPMTIVQAPITVTEPQAQGAFQIMTVTTTGPTVPTTQSEPLVVISEVSAQPADGTWAPSNTPIHKLTDEELQAYLHSITSNDT